MDGDSLRPPATPARRLWRAAGPGERPALPALPLESLTAAGQRQPSEASVFLFFSPPFWPELPVFTLSAWNSVPLEIQPPRAAAAAASF